MLYHSSLTILFRLLCICCALLAMPPAQAQQENLERHQVIDGISVYLGVLPIQMARNESDELNLPDKVYKLSHRYYVLIAMFDSESGRRIVNARVNAKVAALGGLDFSEKQLEPIHIEKMVSFGNYFHMADADVYKINVTINMPARDKTVVANFVYRRPRD